MDTFGDLTLRQSFFKGLLDLEYDVTLVVQDRFAVLLPFLDKRLKWISTTLNPKAVSLASKAEIERLRIAITALAPDALVSPEYFYTDLEQWVMLLFPHLPRFGFENPRLAGVFKITQPWIYLKLQGWNGAFNHEVKGCMEGDHEFSKSQAMFKKLTGKALTALPHITLSDEVLKQNQTLLSTMGLIPESYVIAALGGNTNASLKLLPAETCAKTIIYLKEKYNLPCVVTGVESETAHLQKIVNYCEAANVPVSLFIGTPATLGALLYLIQHARFYYGNDTGAMHFAGALQRPVLAHFGGGGAYKFLPLAEKSCVLCQDLPCYGCGWHCWAGTPLCINRVSQDKLYEAVDWILDSHAEGKRLDLGEKLSVEETQTIRHYFQIFQRNRKLKLGMKAIWRNILSLGFFFRR